MSFLNCDLPIDQLFTLLSKPRNITREEFMCIVSHMSLARFAKDRVEGDTKKQVIGINQRFAKTDEGEFRNILELTISIDLVPSKGEARKLIKASGLFVNKKQITENFVLSEEDFFDTGTDWKFAVMRKGKTNHEIILI